MAAIRPAAQSSQAMVRSDDGTAMHFDSRGSGEVRVVLAGGPGLTPSYMKAVCDEIAKSAQCVLLHQRGTGRSVVEAGKVSASITLQNSVADLEALRRSLGQDRLTLVGHSWGGMLAMAYAAAHPRQVKALVLLASGGPTLEYMSWYSKNAEARVNDEDRKVAAYWEDLKQRGVSGARVETGLWAADMSSTFVDRTKVTKLVDVLDAPPFSNAVFQQMMQDLNTHKYDLRPALRSFSAPVLIVQGREDPIATVGTLRATFPSAQVQAEIIEKAGHFLWLEQPVATFGAMARFFAASVR